MAEVAVFLAPGFEEIEALLPVDIWRRCGIAVKLLGVKALEVEGAHGVAVKADGLLTAGLTADALFLPGGMPGAANLRAAAAVLGAVRDFAAAGKVVSAICAAPMVLSAAGLLSQRRFAMYPGMENFLHPGEKPTGNLLEVDGNLITGKGPGAASALVRAVAAALGVDPAPVLAGMFWEN